MMQLHNKKSYYFFINPKSGVGTAVEIFRKAREILAKNNISSEVYVSECKGDIAEKISTINLTNFSGIIIIGGDGTIHEAINGLIRSGKSHYLPVGVIPSGSGNAFASDLNINEIDKAIDNIIRFEYRDIDVMQINHKDGVCYSANILGWGMAARVNSIAEKLRFLGGIRYTIASFICIVFLKFKNMDISIDDKCIKCQGLLFLALNTIHTGKGMKMAPYAKLDDGLIDLILFRNASRYNIFRIFLKIYSGDHIFCDGVEYKQASEFSINTEDDPLNIDGEIMGRTPVKVRIMRNKIKVITSTI
tara:strand:- start:126 stop:1037 length:912 start_codon:yes stop_codon:yes gene_type:complete